jgi:hypothetical protein
MNYTKNLAIALGMLAAIVALIGTVGIDIQQTAAAYARDPNSNSIDAENSETNFSFKQKLKNNCSGFAGCVNTATETETLGIACP